MAKRDVCALRAQHARGEALLEVIEVVAAELLQEPELGLSGHDGDRLEQPAGGRGETTGPRQHSVSDGLRNLLAAGREDLDHEERITARAAVKLVGIDAVRLGQIGDSRCRERLHPQPSRPPHQLSKQEAKLSITIELLIPVARQHERGS